MSGKCSRPSCYVSQKKKSRWQPEAAKTRERTAEGNSKMGSSTYWGGRSSLPWQACQLDATGSKEKGQKIFLAWSHEKWTLHIPLEGNTWLNSQCHYFSSSRNTHFFSIKMRLVSQRWFTSFQNFKNKWINWLKISLVINNHFIFHHIVYFTRITCCWNVPKL